MGNKLKNIERRVGEIEASRKAALKILNDFDIQDQRALTPDDTAALHYDADKPMVQGIGDKIRNQLAVILGNAYIDLDEHSDVCIKEIIQAGKKIDKLVKGIK